jgi:hypothetical protein
MDTLTYSISGDFSDGVDTALLQQQVLASDCVAVLSHINTDGDDCILVFGEEPSTGDEAIVDALVANHTRLSQAEKNFLVAEYANPHSVLVKETWYGTDNGDGTYSDPVEETVYTYTNSNKVLVSKTVTPLFPDGTLAGDVETWNYVSDDNKKIMKKAGV